MKLFTFKQKVSEVIKNLHSPGDISVRLSRDKNGDFRADCSDGTVVIGGYNTRDFTVYRTKSIAS